jgi:hypothetical protein
LEEILRAELATVTPQTTNLLTIISIITSIILNGVLIYKNTKKKNYQDTTDEK